MDLLDYATDPQLEEEGAWVPMDSETKLLVARFENPKFRKMRERLSTPIAKARGRAGLTKEDGKNILNKCMAKHLLLGWQNLCVGGEIIPYSPEKCLALLQDRRLQDFKELVLGISQNLEHYRLESLEEDSGNLSGSSSTTQPGRKKTKSSSKASRKKTPA